MDTATGAYTAATTLPDISPIPVLKKGKKKAKQEKETKDSSDDEQMNWSGKIKDDLSIEGKTKKEKKSGDHGIHVLQTRD